MVSLVGFKPYYKWITFNTEKACELFEHAKDNYVLNLIINGLPSILEVFEAINGDKTKGFKPYYKWITFNTVDPRVNSRRLESCFKPYYKWITFNTFCAVTAVRVIPLFVLNLIINGLPSIHLLASILFTYPLLGFKPYYKWITFNTLTKGMNVVFMLERSLFYMVAKFEHFSVIHGLLTFYIKFLLQFFYFF